MFVGHYSVAFALKEREEQNSALGFVRTEAVVR